MNYFERKTNQQPKTLIERLGFRDEQLTTPEHDELILWLDGQLRTEAFCRELVCQPEGYGELSLDEIEHGRQQGVAFVNQAKGKLAEEALPDHLADAEAKRYEETVAAFDDWVPTNPSPVPPPAAAEITWEYAVGDHRWVAGFVDVYAEISRWTAYDQPGMWGGDEGRPWDRYTHWSPPRWATGSAGRARFAFEAKTKMPSLGELVRQIRFYEAKWRATPPSFYVVHGDERFAPTLQGQGIGFVHYPSAHVTHPGS